MLEKGNEFEMLYPRSFSETARKSMEYIGYIEKHRFNVKCAWNEVKEKCKDEYFVENAEINLQIYDMIQLHDISKYSIEEFMQYRKNYYPTSGETKSEKEFEIAWQHHKENNPHHWQYWQDKDLTKNTELIGMAMVEMICDWQAMGYEFGDNALAYYNKNKDNIVLIKRDRNFVERILNKLCNE